jgi:hypothetical protein
MKETSSSKVGDYFLVPLFRILSRATSNVQLFVPKFTWCTFNRISQLFGQALFSDTTPSGRLPNMALRTSMPLRPFLGARALHTAPVVRQAPAVPPRAPRTAAELGFDGNQDRTRTLDPALTKPLKMSNSSYLHLPKESQHIGTGRREEYLVSSSSASTLLLNVTVSRCAVWIWI